NDQKEAYRRVITVNEIEDYEKYKTTCQWRPVQDNYLIDFDQSFILTSIAQHQGVTKKDLIEEIGRRQDVLHWMRERNIRSYKDVAAIIAEYYARPKHIYKKMLAGEEVKAVAASRDA
ncbi:MAG: hypothetical protein NWE80_02525, partial [Candidatus Bathyarchaeota archaeon]|nr:hypothetical protein [Candidatus Bathyarchaeota archaeon]